MKATIKNGLLVLAGLLAALTACELYLRAFFPIRSVGASLSQYDPLYGSSLKPHLHTVRKSIDFTMRLSTNSLGFRGPEPTTPVTNGVVFLGDSYTMGYGVNDGEEFPALIASKLKTLRPTQSLPVVNMGVGRTGNGRWLRFLRHEASRYSPRVVVFQLMGNDYEDNVLEGLFTLAPDQRTLIEQPVPPPGRERQLQRILELIPFLAESYLVGLVRQAWAHPASALAPDRKEAHWPGDKAQPYDLLTYRIVEESVATAQKNGVTVVFASVGVEGARSTALGEHLAPLGIRPVRLPSKWEAPELYYRVDGHWNAAGHAAVAETIGRAIVAALDAKTDPERTPPRNAAPPP
jgi:lysophospholipase L1-like esterase